MTAGRLRAATWLILLAVGVAPQGASAAEAGAERAYTVRVAAPGANSVRLFAEEWGQGPPLLLLHGLGGSTYSWHRVAPLLARDHRVIALDLKGFGRSEKPFDRAYSAADHAALVMAFIEKRGLQDLTLVGHSFGGLVALIVAIEMERRGPGRINRLVVIGAPALPQEFLPATYAVEVPIAPYVALGVTPPEVVAWVLLTYARTSENPPSANDVRVYAKPYYELGGRHALIATGQGIVAADFRPYIARYPAIRQPTLLVWCRKDRVVPLATGRKLARLLPNARLALLDGCNHLPPDERNGALVGLIRQFVAQ